MPPVSLCALKDTNSGASPQSPRNFPEVRRSLRSFAVGNLAWPASWCAFVDVLNEADSPRYDHVKLCRQRYLMPSRQPPRAFHLRQSRRNHIAGGPIVPRPSRPLSFHSRSLTKAFGASPLTVLWCCVRIQPVFHAISLFVGFLCRRNGLGRAARVRIVRLCTLSDLIKYKY